MTENTKRRHAAIAAFLSLLVWGLGQLYNGEPRRALVFFALYISSPHVAAEILGSTLAYSFPGLVILCLFFVAFFALFIFVLIDAAIGARRAGNVTLRAYQRWYIYLTAAIIGLTVYTFTQPEYSSTFRTYSVSAGSLLPAIVPGDFVVADKIAYRDWPPERGDLVIFKKPPSGEIEFVKRLVGMPGDRIQIRSGMLYINGTAVRRQKLGEREFAGAPVTEYRETMPNGREHLIWEIHDYDSTPEFLVPPDHYFFMGDNRDYSFDSRAMAEFGFVPANNLIGRILYVYWAEDLLRIGTALR